MSVVPSAPDTTTAAVAADVDLVGDAFEEFTRALRRARGRAAAASSTAGPGGLTLAQYSLLEPLLLAGEPLGAGEVAVAAGIAPPTATRALDGLQHTGLITRDRNGPDRRCVRVALTPAGRERVTAKRAEVLAWREQVVSGLSPDERRHAARILAHFAAAVEDFS